MMSSEDKGAGLGGRKRLRVAAALPLGPSYDNLVRCHHGVSRYAAEAGWRLEHLPFLYREWPASDRFDGVVGVVDANVGRKVRRRKVPAVNIGPNSPMVGKMPGVYLDLPEVGRQMARHLTARGLVRFGQILWQDTPFTLALRKGFVDHLDSQGVPRLLSICNVPFGIFGEVDGWRAGTKRIDEWIQVLRPPVGIFCHRLTLLEVLADRVKVFHDLNVPRDVALIGAGSQPTDLDHPSIKITGVRLNWERVGYEAARMLARIMDGYEQPNESLIIEPGEVIVRESTDVTAVDDRLVASAMRFMAEHCHFQIQVEDVAASVAVGRRTLERRFRLKLRRTVASQLEYMRIERAKRILVETKDPIKQIALQCGYGGAQQFHLAFVRREGMTPTQFRKKKPNKGG